MKKLLNIIKSKDLAFFLEVFILVMIVVVPSIVTFLGSKVQAFNIIIPLLLLYVPFFVLILVFDKKKIPNTLSVAVFAGFLLYFLIMYLVNKYFDIYSEKNHGLFKIINGYSSFFAILFFSIKYKTKSFVWSLKISSFLLFAISIVSMLVSDSYAKHSYDMNFGYKILFCCLSFVSLLLFSEKRISYIVFSLMAIASLVLLLLFGSRGPLISLVLFLVLFYNFYFKEKLSKKIRLWILVISIVFVIAYVISCVVISNSAIYDTLPRNLQTIFNPFSALFNNTSVTRKNIYAQIYLILKDTPFFGYGPLADQYFLGPGVFSHNLILEMMLTFGFFVGCILLFFIVFIVGRVLYLSDEYKTETLYFLIFLCLSFGRLLVSYSFWYDINFWIMIGSGIMILQYDRSVKKEKEKELSYSLLKDSNKCYFLHFGARKMTGVSKKIDDQIKELSRYFETIEIDVAPKKTSFISKVIATMPFCSISREYKESFSKISDASYIYIRNTIIDLRLLLFIRKLRKAFPGSKIIVELYTYPYDKCEFARKNNWAFFYKDFIYRHFYKHFIDRFVVYGDFDKVFGVKTIKTINGIDFSSIAPKVDKKKSDAIDLISVAQYQNHHAYDRLIKGIADYYKNGGQKNIVYHVVGFGMSLDSYKELVEKLKLEDHVIFYGKKEGKELDEIYDKCDIAVATLGFHRAGVKVSSALKTREYLAKGMPIVYAGKIDIIDEDFNYQYCAPEDESNLDVEKIINLYDNYYSDAVKAKNYIISYVKEKASIEAAFVPIIDFYKSETKDE